MSNIEWTDETWNSIVGCSRISPGCANCYAATTAASPRLQQFPQYQKVKDWDGTVEFVESQLLKPLSWKKPKRIFVCSMSDLFHENVSDEWRDRIFAVMAMCPQHTFQVLTKRPENALRYLSQKYLKSNWREKVGNNPIHDALPKDFLYGYFPFNSYWNELSLPLGNVWVGTTVENQAMADKRIPLLLEIPSVVRWLSVEPLLGQIDLGLLGTVPKTINPGYTTVHDYISWVVVGGESGKGARLCHIDWVRSLVRQCQSADVRVFVKQLGSNPVFRDSNLNYYPIGNSKGKNNDISTFPKDLQIREFPYA